MECMSGQWMLIDGKAVPATDLIEWARWIETGHKERVVAKTQVGDGEVSTVFLGLDHNFGEGPPVLWETMVFGGPLDEETERYTSREDAKAGHAAMVKRVEEAE